MRAADADRVAAAERIRTALNEGRLDLAEYDERVRRAYAAKTYAELDELLADLPVAVPGASVVAPAGAGTSLPIMEPAGAPMARPEATRRWLMATWGHYLQVNALVIGIWLAICLMSGGFHYFWPGWVALPWGVVLLVTTATGLSSGEPQRWAAEQAREEQARLERRVKWGLDSEAR
jgi:hypothetical protein